MPFRVPLLQFNSMSINRELFIFPLGLPPPNVRSRPLLGFARSVDAAFLCPRPIIHRVGGVTGFGNITVITFTFGHSPRRHTEQLFCHAHGSVSAYPPPSTMLKSDWDTAGCKWKNCPHQERGGTCTFGSKSKNAKACGAVGVIMSTRRRCYSGHAKFSFSPPSPPLPE